MSTAAPEQETQASATRRRAHAEAPERVDVAIVGAGLGGLVAGAKLAASGKRVAIFESHYTAGGCATQFSRGPRKARYHFDVGLHYIGDCARDGSIPRILRELGIELEYEQLDPNGFDRLVFPDLEVAIPANLERYRGRLLDLFPHEARGIDRYVGLVDAVMRVSRTLELADGRRPGLRELAGMALPAIKLGPIQEATIGQVLDSMIRDERLKAVILGQSGDYGLPPSKVSALLHMGLAGHYFRGAYYPKGGGQVIADRLVERIEAAGGSVHLRAPVERILVEGGRAVGLRLAPRAGGAARDVRAEVVVSNADLKRTLLELVGPAHLPGEWITRAERFEMAAALFILFLGVEGDLKAHGLTNANVWQFDGYDVEGFYGADTGRGPIAIKGSYITSASLKDPSNALHHAPEGVGNLEVMAVVPGALERWGVPASSVDAWSYKHEAAYQERKREVEENLLARLHRLYPSTEGKVVFRESATPVSHRRYTGATDGTGYGLAATPAQFMKKRPGYRGPIGGLYFAGASTRAGHGIVGSMMSGRSAALRVLADADGARARR
jgi:phytoene dehydrogenase-like protein